MQNNELQNILHYIVSQKTDDVGLEYVSENDTENILNILLEQEPNEQDIYNKFMDKSRYIVDRDGEDFFGATIERAVYHHVKKFKTFREALIYVLYLFIVLEYNFLVKSKRFDRGIPQ